MSNPQENEMSHPLEQATGEKDVHPEEEEGARPEAAADDEGDGVPGAEDTSPTQAET